MKSKRLTVLVKRREALPVRAIPYVTGWLLPPDAVARQLAKKVGTEFAQLKGMSAYHLQSGSPIRVIPKEWDAVVIRLDACGAELRAQFPDHDRGTAAWRDKAVSVLPPGVFVWLKEFKREFRKDVSPERITYTNARPGDRALIFTPMLPDGIRQIVLEGFEVGAEFEPTDAKAELAPRVLENWKMQIQAEAAIRWRDQRKEGCSPTKHALKDELAKWCIDNDVVTETTGITPNSAYIYRHVLRQWTPPKVD